MFGGLTRTFKFMGEVLGVPPRVDHAHRVGFIPS